MAKKVYDLAECKKHVSDKDCWLVVHGARGLAGHREGEDEMAQNKFRFLLLLLLLLQVDLLLLCSTSLPPTLSNPSSPPTHHTGKVYDVTSFLEEHPGGYDVILTSSGEFFAAVAAAVCAALMMMVSSAVAHSSSPPLHLSPNQTRQGCDAGL